MADTSPDNLSKEVSNHVVQTATTGRAKCRGCDEKIAKGQWRLGERVPNPFGDGEATYWFHLRCAAFKRPEVARPTLEDFAAGESTEEDPPSKAELNELIELARHGEEHYRLARITGVQPAPTGRARCRHCKELIPKEAWRIPLKIWEEGRYSPMGFLHVSCGTDYFGTADFLSLLKDSSPDLNDAQWDSIQKDAAQA